MIILILTTVFLAGIAFKRLEKHRRKRKRVRVAHGLLDGPEWLTPVSVGFPRSAN